MSGKIQKNILETLLWYITDILDSFLGLWGRGSIAEFQLEIWWGIWVYVVLHFPLHHYFYCILINKLSKTAVLFPSIFAKLYFSFYCIFINISSEILEFYQCWPQIPGEQKIWSFIPSPSLTKIGKFWHFRRRREGGLRVFGPRRGWPLTKFSPRCESNRSKPPKCLTFGSAAIETL